MSKRTDKIFAEMCALVKPTAKKKQLYKYLLEWAASKGEGRKIGNICKDLHTTVHTYFKTYNSLKIKGLAP